MKGFSIFCDWQNVDKEENRGFNLEELMRQDKEVYSELKDEGYWRYNDDLKKKMEETQFRKVLDREFLYHSIKHKYILEDFEIELKATLNWNELDQSKPAHPDCPYYIEAVLHIGSSESAFKNFNDIER